MPRCCEASRSVGPKGPLASRAPWVFPGRADPPKRASAKAEKDEGLPGADTRIRAMMRVRMTNHSPCREELKRGRYLHAIFPGAQREPEIRRRTLGLPGESRSHARRG